MRHVRRGSQFPRRIAAVTVPLLMAVGLMTAAPGHAVAASATTLAGAFDNVGVSADDAPASADLDGDGASLSAADLATAGWTPGSPITVDATRYTVPDVPAGTPDNVVADGQRVRVGGTGDALGFLATATGGPATGRGTVEYADGSASPYTLTVDDWHAATDSEAVTLPHTNDPAGQRADPASLHAVTVPIRRYHRVVAVTLPPTEPGGSALHVFSVAVRGTPSAPDGRFWTGSWAASIGSAALPRSPDWRDQTLRMVVEPHTSGGVARLRFANTFSPAPVRLGRATVAVQSTGPDTAAPPVPLTFGGDPATTIPAGGEVYSDPVAVPVVAGRNLLVSLYLPDSVTRAPIHSYALTTSYTSDRLSGDHTGDPDGRSLTGTFSFWAYLAGVDVATRRDVGTIVALGDSQTDGAHSTPNTDRRWPDDYARILDDAASGRAPGVVNAGISGNRLLLDQSGSYGPSALDRLDRDVFSEPDARAVILYEGINDISLDDAGAAALEAGIREVVDRARARGLVTVVTTIPAFGGNSTWTEARERVRQEVNTYIRTSRDIPAYADFDLVTRDPAMPSRLLDGYDDPADHLHFNDTGCEVLAQTLAHAIHRRHG